MDKPCLTTTGGYIVFFAGRPAPDIMMRKHGRPGGSMIFDILQSRFQRKQPKLIKIMHIRRIQRFVQAGGDMYAR